MRSPRRLLLLAASSLALMGGAALPAVALTPPSAVATQNAQPSKPWAQAASDIPADAAVRFGVLPNGMRYAIMKNATPPGQASLRLRIAAGSLMENEDQLGLAHFMEHMAFNGTTNVPENELLRILERLGLAFGADTNAFTSFDQTAYTLELPRTNDETVDTALMLMREAAGNLTLDQGAIDRERGVVLSEERARDTPPYRVYKERLDFFLKGQRPPTRYPIGKVEVLQTAQAAEFTDFYNRYYRPEQTVVVVVGDFDVDAMEARIKAKFGDWTPSGPAGQLCHRLKRVSGPWSRRNGRSASAARLASRASRVHAAASAVATRISARGRTRMSGPSGPAMKIVRRDSWRAASASIACCSRAASVPGASLSASIRL